MNKAIYHLFILIFFPNILFGQTSLYQWNSHISFAHIKYVDGSVERIFAATNEGVFSQNLSDNNIETFSSVNGLSDSGISAIKWTESLELLIIGYSNGNIDLVNEDGVSNIPYIKRETGILNSQINNIIYSGEFAWLCCGFGIVKLNLPKKEISETWIIGPGGTSIEVFDISFSTTHYIAATNEGLYRADINNQNLQDYSQWEKIDNIPGSSDSFTSVDHLNDNLYTLNSQTGYIYMWDGNFWQRVFSDTNNVKKIREDSGELLIISNNSVERVNNNGRSTIDNYGTEISGINTIKPEDAFLSADGELWIGDMQSSLIHSFSNGGFEQIMPNGPGNSFATNISSYNGKTYFATGSKNGTEIIQKGIHIFSENTWSSVNTSQNPDINNLLKVIPNPANTEQYYAASWENGLSFFDKDNLENRFDQSNSPLEAFGENCRIGGLAYDSENNLWITNAMSEHQVHFIGTNGEWHSFSYPGISNTSISTGEILVTERGTKWIIVDQSELFAINSGTDIEDINDDEYRKIVLRSIFSNGNTTSTKRFSKIFSMAEDLRGELWLGTDKGVVVYYNPDQVFNEESLFGIQPGIDLGDGLYHPLLEKEEVSSIAVDGSNRKWFGTFGSGVFLFSEDGDNLVRHFNTENSPLPSNNIKSIGIDNNSGEVFFATEGGLVSYKSDATGGKNSYADVYAYPNPVRETFKGDITIEGLMSETIVKITDITGNLVFETTSNGGRATWNGNNSYGRRVNTGVYLIFCSTRTGEESFVTKLLFIR
jgi:sugar lactone lactonase YvrE